MRKKNYKGRCIKKSVGKSKEICRTYDDVQLAYLDVLQADDNVVEINCNVSLEGSELGEYTTDFMCVNNGGDLMVRECVLRNLLSKPRTAKLLDLSRVYWLKRGVKDWGIVTNEKE